jgi:tRNA(Ile)-lysidine synthase
MMQKLSTGQFLYFCTMLKAFKKFVVAEGLFVPEDKILLAVSGGMDSLVMTELFRKAGFHYGIAHCNFMLRGDDSEKDELFVAGIAREHHVPFFSNRFRTAAYAQEHGISIQMAARVLRYEWFREIMQGNGYDFIATAHHLDDQAETFFINMIRSSGIAGFHGILPKQGKVVRPLLFATRREIEKFSRENAIVFREDTSNHETKYLRNKIRHEILPVLLEISPDFVQHQTENILRIREAEQIYREAIEAKRAKIVKSEEGMISISVNDIRNLNPAGTYLHELLSPYGFNFSQVKDLLKILDKISGKTILSPTHRLVRDREKILITLLKKRSPGKGIPKKIIISKTTTTLGNPLKLSFRKLKNDGNFEIDPSREIASLDMNKLSFPLLLRKWEHGDFFYPFGRNHRKKLSDFFIDEKISIPVKENTWVLCSGKDIIWIVGHRIDNRFRITSRTKEVLRIRLTP